MNCYIDRESLTITYYKETIDDIYKVIQFKNLNELESYLNGVRP